MDVQVKGTVAAIEKAFHVTMGVYQHPTENRTFFAPDREPTVDLPFQLWHISGLDNYSTPALAWCKHSELKACTPMSQAPALAATIAAATCAPPIYGGIDFDRHRPKHRAVRGGRHGFGRLEHVLFECWAN